MDELAKTLAVAGTLVFLSFTLGFLLQPHYAIASGIRTTYLVNGSFFKQEVGSNLVYFRGSVYAPEDEVIGFKTFYPDVPPNSILLGERPDLYPKEELDFVHFFQGKKYLVENEDQVKAVNALNPFGAINPLQNYGLLFAIEWAVLIAFTILFLKKISTRLSALNSKKLFAVLLLLTALSLIAFSILPRVWGDEAFNISSYSQGLKKQAPLLDALGKIDLFYWPTYVPFFLIFGEVDGFRIHSLFFMLCAAVLLYLLSRDFLGSKREAPALALLATTPFILQFSVFGIYRGGLSLLFFTLFLYAAFKALEQNDPWLWVFAGVFAGAAFRTYPIMAVLIPALALIVMMRGWKKLFSPQFLLALGLIGLFALPVIAFYATHDPSLSIGYLQARSGIVGGLVENSISVALAAFSKNALNAALAFVSSFFAGEYLIPALFSVLVLAGLLSFAFSKRDVDGKKLAVLGVVFALGFFALSFINAENIQPPALIPLAAPLFLTASAGLDKLLDKKDRIFWILALLVLISFGQSVYATFSQIHPLGFTSQEITDYVNTTYLNSASFKAAGSFVFIDSALDKAFYFNLGPNPKIITISSYYDMQYPHFTMEQLVAKNLVRPGDAYVSWGEQNFTKFGLKTAVKKVFGSSDKVVIYEFTN